MDRTTLAAVQEPSGFRWVVALVVAVVLEVAEDSVEEAVSVASAAAALVAAAPQEVGSCQFSVRSCSVIQLVS